MKQQEIRKLNGAVGNYNALHFVCPTVDWQEITKDFIENILGLTHNPYTTQIESHDFIAEILHNCQRWNTICIDLTRDIWSYISMAYLKQRTAGKQEVGSSTMPHKVNPIDFENAEGNYGLSNSISQHLSQKLQISRLQRDLSDSTSLRALGTVFAHQLLAQKSLQQGFGKIEANLDRINKDLCSSWEVLTEAIQSQMRHRACVEAYDIIKVASRGKKFDKIALEKLLSNPLNLEPQDIKKIQELTPETYTGLQHNLLEILRKKYVLQKQVNKFQLALAPMEGVTDFPTRLWMQITSAPDLMSTPFLRLTKHTH